MIDINLCYVIGTSLMYMKKLNREDLNNITNVLSESGYSVNISDENIYEVLKEWRDFFMFNEDNTEISLTENTDKCKNLIQKIFVYPLEPNLQDTLFKAILYRNKNKCKIISFKK